MELTDGEKDFSNLTANLCLPIGMIGGIYGCGLLIEAVFPTGVSSVVRETVSVALGGLAGGAVGIGVGFVSGVSVARAVNLVIRGTQNLLKLK